MRSFWEVRCDCGNRLIANIETRRSCGCARDEARARGQATMKAKTMKKLEKLGKGPLSLAQAARMFHVKQRTLWSRMRRYPDNPEKWTPFVGRRRYRKVNR